MDWNKAREYCGGQTLTQIATLAAFVQEILGVRRDGCPGPETALALARTFAVSDEVVVSAVEAALTQVGKPYVFGAEVSPSDADPDAHDCSELVEWAFARAGALIPDGSWNQVTRCRDFLTLVPADAAIAVRGALLFRFKGDPFAGKRPRQAHVAISLGDGRTVEARSRAAGVGIFDAAGRGWTHAGLVPGDGTSVSARLRAMFLDFARRVAEFRSAAVVGVRGPDDHEINYDGDGSAELVPASFALSRQVVEDFLE